MVLHTFDSGFIYTDEWTPVSPLRNVFLLPPKNTQNDFIPAPFFHMVTNFIPANVSLIFDSYLYSCLFEIIKRLQSVLAIRGLFTGNLIST